MVSTEDDQIAEIARSLGAWVPFSRPSIISGDHATTIQVMQHAVRFLTEQGREVSEVCCMYGTSAFAFPDALRAGLRLLRDLQVDFVFSAIEFPHPIERAMRLTDSGLAELISPEFSATRTQDCGLAFHDAGQFYWGTCAAWMQGLPILGGHSAPLFLPKGSVVDIDTQEDWAVAEAIFQIRTTLAEATAHAKV
jgi:N-acylneuraminate cytidylyltransferase